MSAIPETMTAVVTTGHGGFEKLQLTQDWPVPVPQPGEALIRVRACGLNNTDINTRIGWYNSTVTEGTTEEGGAEGYVSEIDGAGGWGYGVGFPLIQGADVCGEVVGLGDGAPAELLGKRVLIDTWLRDWGDPENPDKARYYGSEAHGGYAEYTVAPIQNIHPIESRYTDIELASFATSYVTAENMLHQADVKAGEVVLIPGASGGVGSALIQLCRRRGAIPVALCGEAKAEAVKALGAEAVLPRAPDDLAAALHSAIGRATVDIVADVVGGPMFDSFLDVLVRRGRYTCAGAIAGPIVQFDLRKFYLRDLVFTGATIIPPGLFKELVGYIAREEVKPVLGPSSHWRRSMMRRGCF